MARYTRARGFRISFTAVYPKQLIGIDPRVADTVRKYTKLAADQIVEEALRDYARVPDSTSYVRTYELFNSWKVTPTRYGGGTGYQLINDARTQYPSRDRPYAVYVQGRRQSYVHASRGWRTIDTILADWGGNRRMRQEAQTIISQHIMV